MFNVSIQYRGNVRTKDAGATCAGGTRFNLYAQRVTWNKVRTDHDPHSTTHRSSSRSYANEIFSPGWRSVKFNCNFDRPASGRRLR